jgi:hypothetical protein
MNSLELTKLYDTHKNLKIVGEVSGIPWQTVYYKLKKIGVSIIGDKSKYGCDKDKLASKGELLFKTLVPFAENLNEKSFQAKVDFDVFGYKVDVKTSNARKANVKLSSLRWAFSLKKQESIADFFVCIGFKGDDYLIFMIPGEIFRHYSTVSIACSGNSKWYQYQINPDELQDFFKNMKDLKV